MIRTGGDFLGMRLCSAVSPISTKVSGPNTATPFSNLGVRRCFLAGVLMGINSVVSLKTSYLFSSFSPSSSGASSSSSPSIIRGICTSIFCIFFAGADIGIGSLVFLSSDTFNVSFIVTLSFLLSSNFSLRVARSKPFCVSSTISGAFFSAMGAGSPKGSVGASSSFFGAMGFLCFLIPFITTATRSLSSTVGFIINFSFNTAKGFIAYIL